MYVGVLYSEFVSAGDFEIVRKYAEVRIWFTPSLFSLSSLPPPTSLLSLLPSFPPPSLPSLPPSPLSSYPPSPLSLPSPLLPPSCPPSLSSLLPLSPPLLRWG